MGEPEEKKSDSPTTPEGPSRAGSTGSLLGVNIDIDTEEGVSEIREDEITPRAGSSGELPRPRSLRDDHRETSGNRPPLPPSKPRESGSPPRPPNSKRVLRKSSFGEISDVSLEMGGGSHGESLSHNRNVSWDINIGAATPVVFDTTTLQPPVLNHETSSGLLSPISSRSKSGKLSLTDIRGENPIENEAEATILRALDERAHLLHDTAAASGILPAVPDAAVDVFRESLGKDASTRTPNSATRKQSIDSPHKPGHRRLKSTATQIKTSLSGLNQMMKQMHEEVTDEDEIPRPPPLSVHGRLRTESKDATAPLSPRSEQKVDQGSLLHNADLLFRRASVPRLDPSPSSSPQPREKKDSRWHGLVANALLYAEKTKDEQPEVTTGVPDAEVAGDTDETQVDVEIGNQGSSDDDKPCGRKPRKKKSEQQGGRRQTAVVRAMNKAKLGVKEDFKDFGDFLAPRKASIFSYFRNMFFFFFIPAGSVAAVLFYAAGNPDLGRDCGLPQCASISWLILFLVRLGVTFTLAKATEIFVIDWLSLRNRLTVKLFGPMFTLGIVQSKGVPFMLMAWSIYNFVLLSGKHKFAAHWLFWQDPIWLFNEKNPSGSISSSKMNYVIQTCAFVLGLCIAVKRFLLGNYFGRRSYVRYGDQLTTLMKKIILISDVARHAKRIEKRGSTFSLDHEPYFDYNRGMSDSYDTVEGDMDSSGKGPHRRRLSTTEVSRIIDPDHRDRFSKSLAVSQKQKIMEILGAWEEPQIVNQAPADTSIPAMLEFRQALTFMDIDFPFSIAFGPADKRESCVESAQKVYERLLIRQDEEGALQFDTIAELTIDDRTDTIDEGKLKELVRLFRPDRKGNLTVVEFVTSVDAVYREMRLLRASIANSGQLDRAFELIFNVGFYILAGCIILAALGLSPLALFFSFSSIILAFAFMIGSASSKYFEGILFILLRRPFDIGDKVHISDVNNALNMGGALTWFVENITLYTTTARLAATNEVATYSNGSLAASRIINHARSPKANIYVDFRFSVDVAYEKVQLFKHAITNFIKDRPREWVGILGFRASSVEQNQGYIQYTLAIQHRESWQNLGPILDSKSALSSFGLEVAKKLDMRYSAPALPVDLKMFRTRTPSADMSAGVATERDMDHLMDSPNSSMLPDVSAIAAMFEQKKDQ